MRSVSWKVLIGPALAILVGLVIFFFIFFVAIIDAGTVGVVSTFGRVSDAPLMPGFNLKGPFSDVITMTTRKEEYTMSRALEEGVRRGDDSIDALTADGLTISLDVTVLYSLKPDQAPRVYRELGEDYTEKLIRPQIRSQIREVAANFTVVEIYSNKRAEVQSELYSELLAALEKHGITLEEVLLRDVKLPESLEASIEQKLGAQQQAEQLNFEIDKAKKEAERKVIEAQGQRDAQRIIGESLTPSYLQYLYIQGLENREGTIYVPTNPENGLPLFRGLQ
jgi:regulator of protease activity HflC (stomatin/prohibitin superfamily)